MTGKALLAAAAAGMLAAGNFGMGAVWNISAEETETADLYYAVIDVPYADFYYGEVNHIEPETNAAAGQYDAEDAVTAAGFRDEGEYDAVTSATTQKSEAFVSSYYEEQEDATVKIYGVSGVNVAISKALYEDVKAQIEAGTECSNSLIDFVSAMGEVSEEAPAEYKVINSDGVLSETVGNTVTAEDVTVTFASVSTWGNYQIDFSGIEIDCDALQGALIETSDGTVYGLEHLDNLWLKPGEIAFCAAEFSDPHGNMHAYNRFSDIEGKTITKVTYMLANADDIEIETDCYVKPLLPEEYSVAADAQAVYSADGTKINVTETVPEGVSYTLTGVTCGRTPVSDTALFSMEDGVVTLSSGLKPGSYSLTFSSDEYADQKVTCMVTSGLEDGAFTIAENQLVAAENEAGLTASDYIAAISSVSVNGEPVSGRNVGSILFDENGNILLDAAIDDKGTSVPVFDGSDSYEIEITATGYPTVTGTVSAE